MRPTTKIHPKSTRPGQRQVAGICLVIGLAAISNLAAAANDLLWFGNGRPTVAAHQAVDILGNAAADGLDARDYDADRLRNALVLANDGPPLADERMASLDQALTAAMLRYLAELRFGRVDPRQIDENFSSTAAGGFDPDTFLRAAIAENRLAEAPAGAAPPLPLYASLRAALADYRALSDDPAWQTPLPPLPGKKLMAGENYAGIPLLTQRLILLGDLPAGTAAPPRYQGALIDGIRSFQERHGLTADGVIGAGTFEQLNVPPAARVGQLELALERLRWTPLLSAPRTIVVNIPEFKLRAYEIRDGRIEVGAAMNVIAGNARKTRTPLFDAEMRMIEFSPYWNVPPSIARGETIPKLRRDPAYFDQQGFEFVGSDGRVVSGFSESHLDAVQRGQMRIRQRPSARNALGDIKFIFPNKDNIYLHHTPTPQLFKRDRRDFSHGCIRVEDPVALARFVLAPEPEWTEERILQAMTRGKSATLRLQEPLPVVIAYSTAMAEGGRVYFFPDIYGQDKVLEEALRRRSAGNKPSNMTNIGA